MRRTTRFYQRMNHRWSQLGLAFLLAFCGSATSAGSFDVGFRRLDLLDAFTGESFPVAVWYPTQAPPSALYLRPPLTPCDLPAVLCRLTGAFFMEVRQNAAPANGRFGLVVISHGAGGLALNHRDLATALASNGYVVAAPAHPRGGGNDVSGVNVWIGRPRQVSAVIERLLHDPELGSRIDRERIGVAGHSNGAYTALAIAGARPNVAALREHCVRFPEDARFCSYGGAATRKATQATGDLPDVRDPRVRAIVAMAPNGALFTDAALAAITVPVRIYGAEFDDLTPVRYHAERIARVLGKRATYVLIKGANHFSFIASFPTMARIWAGEAARDPPGFDRDAMHKTLNLDIVQFFDQMRGATERGGEPRRSGGATDESRRPPSVPSN
jgi:predicted dienelactone hydrolase